uniref:(California timema) hypothetical protein n=1 Tax=Timema californicum TaxID=61474 RepID=A0A7R9J162_TIMCA|nr:unnamed protein product [Timema californicum]
MDQGNLSQSDDQETQNVSKKDRAGIKDGESRSAISDDEDASQTPDDDFSKKFGVGLEEKASKVQEDLTKKHELDAGDRMFKLTFKNVENEDARTLGDVFKIDEESVIDRGSMENFTENRKDSRKPKSPFNIDGTILTDDDDVNDGRIGASKESGGLLHDKLRDIRKERASNNSSEYEGSSGGLGSQKMYTPPPVARDPFTWITGSVYDGTWDLLGMSGRGSYTMPHGLEISYVNSPMPLPATVRAKRNFVENVPDDWSQVSITRSNVMLVCLHSLVSQQGRWPQEESGGRKSFVPKTTPLFSFHESQTQRLEAAGYYVKFKYLTPLVVTDSGVGNCWLLCEVQLSTPLVVTNSEAGNCWLLYEIQLSTPLVVTESGVGNCWLLCEVQLSTHMVVTDSGVGNCWLLYGIQLSTPLVVTDSRAGNCWLLYGIQLSTPLVVTDSGTGNCWLLYGIQLSTPLVVTDTGVGNCWLLCEVQLSTPLVVTDPGAGNCWLLCEVQLSTHLVVTDSEDGNCWLLYGIQLSTPLVVTDSGARNYWLLYGIQLSTPLVVTDSGARNCWLLYGIQLSTPLVVTDSGARNCWLLYGIQLSTPLVVTDSGARNCWLLYGIKLSTPLIVTDSRVGNCWLLCEVQLSTPLVVTDPVVGNVSSVVSLKERHQPLWVSASSLTAEYVNISVSGHAQNTDCVVYEGALKDGKFHGKGTLNYPSGCCISGVWDNGVLQSTSFHFSDGLGFRNVESWKYCKMPDRRFYKEHLLGLRPAGLSHLTQDTPTRPIPEGCYDVGEGFYDPSTKCVTDPEDGRITRVPTAAEEEWIMANCRKAWDQPQGYRPDLYENWWSEQGCKAGDQEEEEDLQ